MYHSLLIHSNSTAVVTSRQHIPVHNIAMCYINAHAGIRLTRPVLYSVGRVQCGACTVWGVYSLGRVQCGCAH